MLPSTSFYKHTYTLARLLFIFIVVLFGKDGLYDLDLVESNN